MARISGGYLTCSTCHVRTDGTIGGMCAVCQGEEAKLRGLRDALAFTEALVAERRALRALTSAPARAVLVPEDPAEEANDG